MTAARTLLDRLGAAGIVARCEGDRLRLRGREPPPDLLAELRGRKAELLAELSQRDHEAAEQDDHWSALCPDLDRCDGWRGACRAIRATRLPAVGTPERERLDREQARMLAGLLAQYRRHAKHRPPRAGD